MNKIPWISRNIDLKYSKYYSLLMLGSAEIQYVYVVMTTKTFHQIKFEFQTTTDAQSVGAQSVGLLKQLKTLHH